MGKRIKWTIYYDGENGSPKMMTKGWFWTTEEAYQSAMKTLKAKGFIFPQEPDMHAQLPLEVLVSRDVSRDGKLVFELE